MKVRTREEYAAKLERRRASQKAVRPKRRNLLANKLECVVSFGPTVGGTVVCGPTGRSVRRRSDYGLPPLTVVLPALGALSALEAMQRSRSR
jgi:hypothetical protein